MYICSVAPFKKLVFLAATELVNNEDYEYLTIYVYEYLCF